jgi:hypothetical protein
MAELADARDSKSRSPHRECGFDPHFRHHIARSAHWKQRQLLTKEYMENETTHEFNRSEHLIQDYVSNHFGSMRASIQFYKREIERGKPIDTSTFLTMIQPIASFQSYNEAAANSVAEENPALFQRLSELLTQANELISALHATQSVDLNELNKLEQITNEAISSCKVK